MATAINSIPIATEILSLAISHTAISHLCNQFNHVYALLISATFQNQKFCQNKPKLKLFLQKKTQNFPTLGTLPPDPRIRSHCRLPAMRLNRIMFLHC